MCNCDKIYLVVDSSVFTNSNFVTDGAILLDLKDEQFLFNTVVNKLNSVNSFDIDSTYPIELLDTKKNRYAFSLFINGGGASLYDIRIYSYIGGSYQFTKLRLLSYNSGDGFSAELVSQVEHPLSLIKGVRLNELEYEDMLFNRANIDAANASQPLYSDTGLGYVFPLVDYGDFFRGNNYITYANFRPFFFTLGLIKRYFCKAGYTFRSPIMESTWGRSKIEYELNSDIAKKNLECSNVKAVDNPTGGFGQNSVRFHIINDVVTTYTYDNFLTNDFSGLGTDECELYETGVNYSINMLPVGSTIPDDEVDPTDTSLRNPIVFANSGGFSGDGIFRFSFYGDIESTFPNWVKFAVCSTVRGVLYECDLNYTNSGTLSEWGVSHDGRAIRTTGSERIYIKVYHRATLGYPIQNLFLEMRNFRLFIEPESVAPVFIGSTMVVKDMLNSNLAYDHFAGVCHLVKGRIYIDYAKKEVWLFSPYDTNILDEFIEGYYSYKNTSVIDIDSCGVTSVNYEAYDIPKYRVLAFKETSDQHIERLYKQGFITTKDLYSYTHDYTDKNTNNETVYDRNPYFEPTYVGAMNSIKAPECTAYIPYMHDNDNNSISFDINPRILTWGGLAVQERRGRLSFVLTSVIYDSSTATEPLVPIAYQDGYDIKINGVLGDGNNVIYGNRGQTNFGDFYRYDLLKEVSNFNYSVSTRVPYRVIKDFNIRGRVILRHGDGVFMGVADSITNIGSCDLGNTSFSISPYISQNLLCYEGSDTDQCTGNAPTLVPMIGVDCVAVNINTTNVTSTYTLTAVYTTDNWATSQTYTVGSNICGEENVKFIFTFVYSDGCPSTVLPYNYIKSCLNTPSLTYTYNSTNNCITVIPVGVNTSPVSSDVIQYSTNGGSTWVTYTSPVCGFSTIKVRRIVDYSDSCPNVEFEFMFNAPLPICSYNVVGSCVINPDGSATPVVTVTNHVGVVSILDYFVHIEYNIGDGWETYLNGSGGICHNGVIQFRAIVEFCDGCNSICVNWQCVATCVPVVCNVGTPTNASICASPSGVLNLISLFSGATSGGVFTWVGTAPPVGSYNLTTGTYNYAASHGSLTGVVYTIRYTNCGTSATANITVFSPYNAGNDGTDTPCIGDVVNLQSAFFSLGAQSGFTSINFLGYRVGTTGVLTTQTFSVNGSSSVVPLNAVIPSPFNVSFATAGQYHFQIRGGNGSCSDNANIVFTVVSCASCPTSATASLTSDGCGITVSHTPTCANPTFQLQTNAGVNIGSPQASNVFLNIASGNYRVVVICGGCTNTISNNISYTVPNAGVSTTLSVCETAGAQDLNLLLGGATSGVWSASPTPPNGTFNTTTGVYDPAPSDGGVGSATYVFTRVVCGVSRTVTVTVWDNTPTQFLTSTVQQCNSLSLTSLLPVGIPTNGTWKVFGFNAQCTGAYSAATFSVNGGAQQTFQPLATIGGNPFTASNWSATGCYLVFYTYSNGSCTNQINVTVTVTACQQQRSFLVCDPSGAIHNAVSQVNINGVNVISSTFNLDNATEQTSLRNAIQNWLTSNGHGGTVSVTDDGRSGYCILINNTTATPTTAMWVDIPPVGTPEPNCLLEFQTTTRTCTYTWTISTTGLSSLNFQNIKTNDTINQFTTPFGGTDDLLLASGRSAVQTHIQNSITNEGGTFSSVTVVQSGSSIVITVNSTNISMGMFKVFQNNNVNSPVYTCPVISGCNF